MLVWYKIMNHRKHDQDNRHFSVRPIPNVKKSYYHHHIKHKQNESIQFVPRHGSWLLSTIITSSVNQPLSHPLNFNVFKCIFYLIVGHCWKLYKSKETCKGASLFYVIGQQMSSTSIVCLNIVKLFKLTLCHRKMFSLP